MIEWMKGTIPLKDFLFDAMTKQEKDFADSYVTLINFSQELSVCTALQRISRCLFRCQLEIIAVVIWNSIR